MDGGAWKAAVHGVTEGRTRLSDFNFTFHFHSSLSCIGEGNGNPLQCYCLENPRDRGAWWAAVCGVAQSRTRLKRLSSSSSIYLCSNLYYFFLLLTLDFAFSSFSNSIGCKVTLFEMCLIFLLQTGITTIIPPRATFPVFHRFWITVFYCLLSPSVFFRFF